MQNVLKVIFTVSAILLSTQASPVKPPVNGVESSYDAIFNAMFNPAELTSSATSSANDPCIAAFTLRNAGILATFGNATLACTNLAPTATADFLASTDVDSFKNQFHSQMSICETKQCYAGVINNNLNAVSLATSGTAYDNTVCIVESAEVMVNDIGVSSDQLIACIDIEDEEGALGGTVPGQLGGSPNNNNTNGLGIPNIFATKFSNK